MKNKNIMLNIKCLVKVEYKLFGEDRRKKSDFKRGFSLIKYRGSSNLR